MFKFDFCVEDVEKDSLFYENVINTQIPNTDNLGTSEKSNWYEAQEVQIREEILENIAVYKQNSTVLPTGDLSLTHIVSGYLLKNFNSSDDNAEDIKKAERNHSDLIQGVYEGGAKIWECTYDLIKYMTRSCRSEMFHGKRVLDLGCGSGLLGIYAYKCGALVHFQDYVSFKERCDKAPAELFIENIPFKQNREVLEKITIPNVVLNLKPSAEADINLEKQKWQLHFYSGDWSKYAELTENDEKFDIILTSETVYNPNNQCKLINTLVRKLSTSGIVLVASKTYYFGVGGSLREFEDLIAKDGHFESKVVWTSSKGISREILELRKISIA